VHPKFFFFRPIRTFTQCLLDDDRLVMSNAPTVESRPKKPTPIVVPNAVKRKYRTRPEEIAEIRLIVGQLFRARGEYRPHQSRIGNGDAMAKEWDVEFEDASVPLDPIPHRLPAKCG
jgi:hypothetical protein